MNNKDTIRYHKLEEISRLLKVITSIRDKAIFTIAYHHGMRVSEVGLLRECDYANNQLQIRREKRGRIRTYDLRDEEVKALKDWIKIRGWDHGPETPLFLSRKMQPIGRRQLDRLMKVYGKKAKLDPEKCYFHTLRHSCAVHMVEADIPLVKIRDWLGHRSIQSTMRYANVSDKALEKTADRFHEYLDTEMDGKKKKAIKGKLDWSGDKK